MKRSAQDGTSGCSKKRVKTSANQDDEVNFEVRNIRCPSQLVDGSKLPKVPGHLVGNVTRLAKSTKGVKSFVFNCGVVKSGGTKQTSYSFEVVLSNIGQDILEYLSMKAGDEVLLSLKGANVVSTNQPKADHPSRQLLFSTGFHVKWKGQTVNTWNLKTSTVAAQGVFKLTAKSTEQPQAEMSKKKQRELQRTKNREKNVCQVQKSAPTELVGPSSQAERTPVKLEMLSQAPLLNHTASVAVNPSAAPINDIQQQEPPMRSTSSSGTPLLLHTRGYTSLATVLLKKASASYVNVIGVVTACSETMRSKAGNQDWHQNIQLVDQSLLDEEDLLQWRTCKINVFAKSSTYLPNPSTGDVVVFRSLKMSGGPGSVIGYPNRYGWALYSEENQQFHHRSLVQPPNPDEYLQLVLYNPPVDHVAVASAIQKWWKEIGPKKEAEMKTTMVSLVNREGRKQHRLISEATPEADPHGYFNCTVEVIYCHRNDNDTWSLYVTDYTKKANIGQPSPPSSTAKVPPEYVLKIEMWDAAAAEFGARMEEGGYYFLNNVRVLISHGGYLEGKIVEPKICQLSPTKQDNHLLALLKRKAEFEESAVPSLENTYQNQLIGDAKVGDFFDATVEILDVSSLENQTFITVYVTDYSRRKNLPIPEGQTDKPWARNLEGMILEVHLNDDQVRLAKTKSFKPRALCLIRHMRLKTSISGQLVGKVGGNQNLIQILDPTKSTAKELIERRESFLGKKEIKERLPSSKLKYIVSNPNLLPNKFRVYGQIVGRYPHKLEECIIQWCSNCNEEVRRVLKHCLACEEAGLKSDSLIPVSRMALTVEDEDGTRAYATLPLESLVLKGIDFSTIFDEVTIWKELGDRLKSISSTPTEDDEERLDVFRPMTLIAWNNDKGDLTLALDDCSAAI